MRLESFDLVGNFLGVTAKRTLKNAQVETGRSRSNTGKNRRAIALRATWRLYDGNLGIGFTTVPRIGFLPVTESVARSRLTLGEHHDPSSATNLSEEIQ